MKTIQLVPAGWSRNIIDVFSLDSENVLDIKICMKFTVISNGHSIAAFKTKEETWN